MKCSDKIVKEPVKVDFHIHSIASKWRDCDKVKNCTIENLPQLIKELNDNEVNMISITDHDNFSYDIYSELKKEEQKPSSSIKKVLPSVEFSVKFDKSEQEAENNDLHIIAIFDDTDDNKVNNIQKNIFDIKKNKPQFNTYENYFSEKEFRDILVNIGIDFILISHQKNSLSSSNKKKHDTNNLNEWQKLFFIGFFDALEFANPKNEIGNKLFMQNHSIDHVNFITGSDCHDWAKYPKKAMNFKFTYLKCLPSFKGIVMSLTNKERIRIGEDFIFFNTHENNIDQIEIKIKGISYPLSLSKGINAIIGDNSVGKPLLLHKLNSYRSCKDKKEYEKYLEDNDITIMLDNMSHNEIYRFDHQGAIRNIFEKHIISSVDFIKQYLPLPPNIELIKKGFKEKIKLFTEYLKSKKLLNEKINGLEQIVIKFEPAITQSENQLNLSIKDNLDTELQDCNNLIEKLNLFKNNLEVLYSDHNRIVQSDFLNNKDRKKLENYGNFINKLLIKYKNEFKNLSWEKNKITIIKNHLLKLSNKLSSAKTQTRNARESYDNSFLKLSQTITDIIKKVWNLKLDIKTPEIKPNQLQTMNKVGDYIFVIQPIEFLKILDKDYLINLIKGPLDKKYSKKIINIESLNDIDPKRFIDKINECSDNNEDLDKLNFYEEKINKNIDKDFIFKPFITLNNKINSLNELSLGKNSLIYFDLLKSVNGNGIYMVDQPEDDISQSSIKKLLISLREISKNRQILLVTHNPQLVVNLDVDNVIFIGKDDETNETYIKYGALEYKDSYNNTNILDIVVNNMEGGMESLKERYKKYE